jgi:ribosomal protein S18 acetylase RimI-like enzyme
MVMIQIRTATKEDAALIADISRETFSDTFAVHNTKADMDKFLSEQFSKEQLIAQVGEDGNTFLLAYINNEPAGYLFLKEGTEERLANKNAIEISRIYARSLFMGKGIGKTLLQAAIAHAHKEKKEHIWLGVWEHNQRAINFYTSFGFEKFGEQDFLLGDDLQHD